MQIMRASFFLVDVATGARRTSHNVIVFVFASPLQLQLKMFYIRCGATSGRQRTAVPVVYGIECSVVMKLKLADEAEVCHFTLLLSFCGGCVHPLVCGETTLFGGVVSSALSGGVVDIGHVQV